MTKSITTELILKAAVNRGWTIEQIAHNPDIYALQPQNAAPYYIKNVTNFIGSGINGTIAKQKEILYSIARTHNLATLPESILYDGNMAPVVELLKRHGSLVVKPTDQSHGDGVTVNISNELELKEAIAFAQTLSANVIVQQQINGRDYRLLFINGEFTAATNREPASVMGDGSSTILQLIAEENAKDTRGEGYERQTSYIDVEAAKRFLGDAIGSIPEKGETIQVIGTANIGAGGRAIDATDDITPELIAEAGRLLKHLRLEFAGVDYIIEDGTPYLIEVNTAPSFGLHAYPSVGKPRDVADAYLDWLVSKSSK